MSSATKETKAVLQLIASTGWAFDYTDKAGRTPYVKIGALRAAGMFETVKVDGRGDVHQLTAAGYNVLGALLAP